MPRSAATRSHGQRKKRRPPTSTTTPKPPIQPVQAKKRWPWLIVLVAAIILVSFGIWRAVSGLPSTASTVTTASTSLPTPTPTPARTWHTLLTFSGDNGTKNTQKFKVPADWQVTWSCRGVNGVDGGLYVVIYNANGSLYNAGAQVTCLASKQVIGSAEEFKSGDVYLNINGNGPWTVSVQQPQ
jgi:hypothetical protein